MVKKLTDLNKRVPAIWQKSEPKHRRLYRAKTKRGTPILFWKACPIAASSEKKQLKRGIDSRYACHGLTVGSYDYPGGPFTPYGNTIDLILKDEYKPIKVSQLKENDVIAWRDEDGFISHTARISELKQNKQKALLDNTRLLTKNGSYVMRTNMRLATVKQHYGHDMLFFRERHPVALVKTTPKYQRMR